MVLFLVFAFMGMSLVAYTLASALQGQNAIQGRVERALEEGRERESAVSELLQEQIDCLQEELSEAPIENLELRIVRLERKIEFFSRAYGMRQAYQVAEMRLRVLNSIRNSRN